MHTCVVIPFRTGESVLRYLEKQKTDLILLDCNMPDLNGFEVLKILQKQERLRGIPVIFLTGSVDGNDETRALESGAIDYLHKPIKPGALMKRVQLQLEIQAHRNKLERMVQQKTEQLIRSNLRLSLREKLTMELLAKASDLRDNDTGEHIYRTMGYVRVVVSELRLMNRAGYRLTEEQGEDIVEASQLHDIGKLAMPDHVLLKPGRLTREEFEIVKEHPIRGMQMLEYAVKKTPDDNRMLEALNIAWCHHERWDGTGYPRGLIGLEIPLSARIAAIADVFDALTSDRPYKKASRPRAALEIICRESGSHFDPFLVSMVRRRAEDFIEISEGMR